MRNAITKEEKEHRRRQSAHNMIKMYGGDNLCLEVIPTEDDWKYFDGDYEDIINNVMVSGTCDSFDLRPDASGDSQQVFLSRNYELATGHGAWAAREKGIPDARVSRAQKLQEAWEEQRRARRLIEETEADQLWEAERRRRASVEPPFVQVSGAGDDHCPGCPVPMGARCAAGDRCKDAYRAVYGAEPDQPNR